MSERLTIAPGWTIGPGDEIRVYFNEGNINNKLLHVRAIVDGEWVVTKTWQKRRKRWHYAVEHAVYFEHFAEHGHMTPGRQSRPHAHGGER